jgi:hypothetical protein
MTNNLPTSTIINLFLSDNEADRDLVENLMDEFVIEKGHDTSLLPDYTLGDLAKHAFGHRSYYARTRQLIESMKKDLEDNGLDLLSTNLALIYNDGASVKRDCKKVHKSYSSGGAYLFSTKLLGLILLQESPQFRDFLRTKTDSEGERFYVPFNLKSKRTKLTSYIAAKMK